MQYNKTKYDYYLKNIHLKKLSLLLYITNTINNIFH